MNRRICITIEFGTRMEDDLLLHAIATRVLDQANRTLMTNGILDPTLPGKFEVTVEDLTTISDSWLKGKPS